MKNILVTGGAGFIGSNFIRHIYHKYPEYNIINLDKLTYAGNCINLTDISQSNRYTFVKGDICDPKLADDLMQCAHMVVNFAAESHVDRSIIGAGEFVHTNAHGVYNLLNAARTHKVERFLQVSTDEVYGSLDTDEPAWTEDSPLAPRNPYSVTKASGDMMAQAFHVTYGFPVVITRASNNIGPFQYPEKRIPLFITNAIDDIPLPIYGLGEAIRDHLFVTDHCEAIDLVLHKGETGQAYNVGADNEADGLEVAQHILTLLDKPHDLINFVDDRPGHDLRYALNISKIRALGWDPLFNFETALAKTVSWYLKYQNWWRNIRSSDDFSNYYNKQYKTCA